MKLGMFSDDGNKKVMKIIKTSNKNKNTIMRKLRKLSKNKKYSEAQDTAVREAVYKFIGGSGKSGEKGKGGNSGGSKRKCYDKKSCDIYRKLRSKKK
jgi:hypothetical protein